MKGDFTLKSRELFGVEVWQKTKNEFFCLTDLVKAGNKWRRKNDMSDFNLNQYIYKTKSTQDFMKEIEKKYGIKPFKKGKATNSKSYGHPLLFIDVALAIHPKLKLEVYEWIMDELVKYRVKSADSYTFMCGVLYKFAPNKAKFPQGIKVLANRVKAIILGNKNKDWDRATEEQLKQRDYLYNLIADFTEAQCDSNKGYEMAINLYIKRQNLLKG